MGAALQVNRVLPGCPDRFEDPQAVHDYADILAQAETALARRQESYPALVDQGRMDRAEAEADIAAWAHLVTEWRWIETGEGTAPPSFTLFDRIAAVDLALDRAGAALARQPRNEDLQRQRDLLTAMRWHLSRLVDWTPRTHLLAALTHAARQRAATSLCPTCERRPGDPAIRACTRTDCGLPGNAPATSTERTAA